jgi:assimilatory nitrate reductase catalytic subunit
MDSLPTILGTATHCPYCALQCGMNVVQTDDGWGVTARDFPTNRRGLCRKGWTAAELLNSGDRLTTPLMRDTKSGPLRPVTWDQALDRITASIRAIQAAAGPDAVAVFGGGGLTNEKAYALGKFARVALGTANIDYNGRFCMASSAAAGLRAFGMDRGMPFPMSDIAAADAVLVTGSNPAETMPPIMQWFDEGRARGGQLIVSDPRRTATARAATLHLPLTPGTDAALANGLLNVAISRRLIDLDYIEARTTGWDRVRRGVASYWPDRVERITGVPAKDVERAAVILGEAAQAEGGRALILSGRGTEQQSHGVDNALAFINLALALGMPGRSGSGWGCLTGQGNGQGGREHGQKADQLPGYRLLNNPQHRADVAAVWGVDPASLPQPGLSACELLDVTGGADARIRGLLVFACNLLVSGPDANKLRDRLGAAELLVVADPFLSETAAIADVVLPVAQWAEEGGTMTNLEGRILLRRKAKEPPAGVWTDLQIIAGIAGRLGAGAHFTGDAETTGTEFRRCTSGGMADYAGASWDRLPAEAGVFWPCPDEHHPGTPRPFLDGFAHPDGRARFHPVEYHGAAEQPCDEYPLILTTGRVMGQYQSGTQTRRVPELAAAEPAAYAEMHPDTARQHGVQPGDRVTLTTRRGTAEMAARITRDIRRDTLFVPFHWSGEGSANRLTIAALDPVSRIPEYKACAVRLDRASKETA